MIKFTRTFNDKKIKALTVIVENSLVLHVHSDINDRHAGISVETQDKAVLSVVSKSLFDGPRGIWSIRISALSAGSVNLIARRSDQEHSAIIDVLVEEPLVLPLETTEPGLWIRLFLSETRNPSQDGYDEQDQKRAMEWMRRVVTNRLKNKPSQFNAKGAKSVFDIVRAPNQVAGFERYPNLTSDVQKRVDAILRIANDASDRRHQAFRSYLTLALKVAIAPFPVHDPSPNGLYGWRTMGSGSPGPRFVPFGPSASGNQFYSLKASKAE